MTRKKKLVLILEDIATYSVALKKVLKGEECAIVVKTTQSEARKYLKTWQPDLIFCDGEAPDGTFIHAVPPHLWTKVVAISGSPGYNDLMRIKGAAALVPKMGDRYELWAAKAVAKGKVLLS
jgi:CheY-like chemotaxis protein